MLDFVQGDWTKTCGKLNDSDNTDVYEPFYHLKNKKTESHLCLPPAVATELQPVSILLEKRISVSQR